MQYEESVTDTPSTNWDGAQIMGIRVTGYKLGARNDEAMNSRS